MKKLNRDRDERRFRNMVTRNWIIALVSLCGAIACYFIFR